MSEAAHKIEGEGGSIDKEGIITFTIPYWVATLEEVNTVGRNDIPLGLAEEGREFAQSTLGGYEVRIKCAGIDPTKAEDDAASHEFDTSFSEEPLESHPNIEKIKEKYGGTPDKDGKIIFPIEMPAQSGGNALGGSQAAAKRRNPMYGVTTYKRLTAIFRRKYTSRTFPSNILNKIATVVGSLPRGFPTPPQHNWLFMPPKITERGNVYSIEEEYYLSPKGGWHEELYQLIDLS